MVMKLYGHPDSGHAYKVALALSMAKIPHEYERVDIWAPRDTRAKDFLAASRFAEVPCLVVDHVAKTQSGAILSWLAREHDCLGGATQHDAALEWVVWEANRIGMCVPQLIQRFRTPEAFTPGAIAFLEMRYQVDIAQFDTALSGKKFILGDDVTIADVAIFGYLGWYEKAELTVPQRVRDWISRFRELEGYAESTALL